jgi:hypothetical protein
MGRPKGSRTHNGKCNSCKTKLIIGENWTESKRYNSDYRCGECYYTRTDSKLSKEQANANRLISNYKEKTKIKPGVYGLYNSGKLIYIGQSEFPNQRITNHFSKYRKLEHAKVTGAVSYALTIGELERKNLTFKMLEFIDDHKVRLTQEQRLIQRHKPRYNEVYV